MRLPYNREDLKAFVADILKQHGLTPDGVAAATGIHRTVIYRLLGGDQLARETLERLSRGVGLSQEEEQRLLYKSGRSDRPPEKQSADPVERVRYALNGIDFMEEYQAQRIKELIDQHVRKKEGK